MKDLISTLVAVMVFILYGGIYVLAGYFYIKQESKVIAIVVGAVFTLMLPMAPAFHEWLSSFYMELSQ